MKIIITEGALKGKEILLDRSQFTIGSAITNSLVLDEPGISALHVHFEKIDNKWFVSDKNSTNGVYLNGQKLEFKTKLKSGDTIYLAKVQVLVNLEEGQVRKVPLNSLNPKGNRVRRKKQAQSPAQGLLKVAAVLALAGVFLFAYYLLLNELPQDLKQEAQLAPNKNLNDSKPDVAKVGIHSSLQEDTRSRESDEMQNGKDDLPFFKIVKDSPQESIVGDQGKIASSDPPLATKAVYEDRAIQVDPKLKNDPLHQFTAKYCFRCHDDKKQKGRVRVDDNDFSISTHSSINRWRDVLDVLNVGDMPPEDVVQPSKEELANVIGELTDRLVSAKKKLSSTGGVITIRHLNKRDYSGSIVDLFGADLDTDDLPLDDPESLDTDGSKQFFTPNHKKIYFTKGQDIARSAITAIFEKKRWTQKQKLDLGGDFNREMSLLKGFKINPKDYKSYSEKELIDKFRPLYPNKVGRIHIPRAILKVNDENNQVGASGRVLGNFRVAPGQRYKLTVATFGRSNETKPLLFRKAIYDKYPLILKFDDSKKRHISSMYITGQLLLQKQRVRDTFSTNHSLAFEVFPTPDNGYIDWCELEPIATPKSYFENCFEKLIANKTATDKDLKQAFEKFCHRAFRGVKPDPEFIDLLVQIYKDDLSSPGEDPKFALINTIGTILSSSSFLYIKEFSKELRKEMIPEDYATRLAYFISAGPADSGLHELAKRGKLKNKSSLKMVISKILKEKRSQLALGNFFAQWIELKRLDQIGLRDDFGESVKEEPLHFFNYLVENNLPVENLIDSDFVLINKKLADHYGIKADITGFEAVKLPKGSNRGGLLAQTAFLAMGSVGHRSSPTIRGSIVRSKFLNNPPPPPPPNVPQIDTQDDGTKTVRQLVDLHKEVPQCASCHEKIDPIGYGLESFDKMGHFRESIRVKNNPNDRKRGRVVEIDASGYLSDTEPFSDFKGFKQMLLKNKDKLARSLFEEMLAYAIGRKIEFIDEEEVDACLSRLKRRNYPMQDMILEVVNSKAFRSK